MKSYLIGRDPDCNIIISDPSNVVSRHHATLVVNGLKMTITDSSTNGTYINGVRIGNNVPVPVTRGDVVSFAEVAVLDWKKVPRGVGKWIIAVVVIVALAALALGGICYYDKTKQEKDAAAEAIVQDDLRKKEEMDKSLSEVEKSIESVCARLLSATDSLNAIEAARPSKTGCSQLTEVTETIGQVKALLKTVDTASLKSALVRVKDNVRDGSSEASSRLDELEKDTQSCLSTLSKASSLLKKASDTMSSIPDKKTSVSADKDDGAGKKNKDKDPQPDTTKIMSPIIY